MKDLKHNLMQMSAIVATNGGVFVLPKNYGDVKNPADLPKKVVFNLLKT